MAQDHSRLETTSHLDCRRGRSEPIEEPYPPG